MLLVASASAQPGASDFVVEARDSDGRPIAGAVVAVGGDSEAATGLNGQVTFEGLRSGRYPVRVSHADQPARTVLAVLKGPGPWSLSVGLGDSPTAPLGENGHAQDLSGSRLAASGFFERQTASLGTILDAEDIDSDVPSFLDRLPTLVQGLRSRSTRYGKALTPFNSSCRVRVFLDGDYSDALTTDILAFRLEQVLVVEFYDYVGQIPVQYRRGDYARGATCGSLLIWTEASLANSL